MLLFYLFQTINDTAPEVREASFDALGTAMKVVSEKVMCALLGDIDALKMAKVSFSLAAHKLKIRVQNRVWLHYYSVKI